MRSLLALILTCSAGMALGAEGLPDFIITLWVSPAPEFTDKEHFQDIADCGINLVLPNCLTVDVANNKKMLDACNAVGLKAIVQDQRLHVDDKISAADLIAAADAVAGEYSSHPALAGYFITDEPSAALYPKIAQVYQHLRQKDPKHSPFLNVFPNYASNAQLGADSYDQYIASFLATVKPNWLSWDHYTLGVGDPHPLHFQNLAIARDHAIKAGIPYMIYIASARFDGNPDPRDVDMPWQVYTSLAYGVTGIGYFTYATFPGMGPGLIGPDGKKTPRYETVKALNKKVKALAPTLLQLKSAGAYFSDPVPDGCDGIAKAGFIAKAEGNALLIGHLQNAKKERFIFVVNRSFSAALTAKLTLEAAIRSVSEISQESGKPVPAPFAQHVLSVDLEAGCGKLFALTD